MNTFLCPDPKKCGLKGRFHHKSETCKSLKNKHDVNDIKIKEPSLSSVQREKITKFKKFAKIRSFQHVWKENYDPENGKKVEYLPKVKLHGSNLGITLDNGNFSCQSRNQAISVENDQNGFANFINDQEDVTEFLQEWSKDFDVPISIYGEWAGPGIQKGEAIHQIPEKSWFIFGVRVGNEIITSPEEIKDFLPMEIFNNNVKIIPEIEGHAVTVDFRNKIKGQEAVEKMTALGESVGERDPFVYQEYGISAPGEGIVWVPQKIDGEPIKEEHFFSSFALKSKSSQHVNKSGTNNPKKEKATIDPVKLKNAQDFSEKFVTPSRLEQAIQEALDGELDRKNTGQIIKWMVRDIQEESSVELESNGLEWKDVGKEVVKQVKEKYIRRCDEVL